MSFCDVMSWLYTIEGISAALGVFLSYVAEYFPKWEGTDPKWKRLIVIGICQVIAQVAVLASWAGGCIEQYTFDVFWKAFMAGWLAFGTSQLAHAPKLHK